MSKAGEAGEINVNELDINAEIARADNDELLGVPMTRRQTRRVSAKSPSRV